MKAKYIHTNINVFDLEKSLKFYEDALGLKEKRRYEQEEGKFILVYLTDGQSDMEIELTWLRDRKEPYNLGDNEIHLAFRVDDFDGFYERHKEMGCICYENKPMGLYFINDPDGWWLEVVPADKH
ncbi:Glyoxalase/bleomycin resistance protein/dioxygenase [Denitrovibrio acetiphilus DSM 12809]|uniref:Aldoketomutase n=1 Tax=Denitrovibrio acetiphilus (strain DSM 12809 / NBRC 114555 / N2460) TaxID=522772 RepID=D4H6U0_DENA2|nr:VOC family protein [Denitrovibrio acetiphilus]ADD67806.1 Glyoxalase/bleomycin resistance protein/dioxygenase [Denitrovibrio acetiphilus DSM 12809]